MLNDTMNPNTIASLNLAFLGDSVFDLLVREHLLRQNPHLKVNELNKQKVALVNCKSQADFIARLMPTLSEEELSVFKRGRNAHSHSPSKHGSVGDYHAATGLEALFGYLFLKGETQRINALFAQIINEVE